jgi:hypothetical protein
LDAVARSAAIRYSHGRDTPALGGWLPAQLADQSTPVNGGQADVAHEHVGLVACDGGQCAFGRADGDDCGAAVLEHEREQFALAEIVDDDEYADAG